MKKYTFKQGEKIVKKIQDKVEQSKEGHCGCWEDCQPKTEDTGECKCVRVGKTEWAVGNPNCKVHYPPSAPLNKDWSYKDLPITEEWEKDFVKEFSHDIDGRRNWMIIREMEWIKGEIESAYERGIKAQQQVDFGLTKAQEKIIIESARASGYEVGYEDGTNSGHADIVAFLDTDSVDWGEAIQEAIKRARASERKEIIEEILLFINYNYGKHTISRFNLEKKLLELLSKLKEDS